MIAALSSHLTPGADALIAYIRMHAANNFTWPYFDGSTPYNNKLVIILLHFQYLKMFLTQDSSLFNLDVGCTVHAHAITLLTVFS